MEFGSAVILAGGKSRRMGFDKQLLQLENRCLLRHQGEQLAELFEQVIVVSNTPELYQEPPFILVGDELHQKGPLGGIHSGLKRAASDKVFFLACDMPNINPDYIRFMQERLRSSSSEACVTRFGNWIEPFNAFYTRNLVPAIEEYLGRGRHSLFKFLNAQNTHYVSEEEARTYSPDWQMFLNLNTPEELAAWRQQNREDRKGPQQIAEPPL